MFRRPPPTALRLTGTAVTCFKFPPTCSVVALLCKALRMLSTVPKNGSLMSLSGRYVPMTYPLKGLFFTSSTLFTVSEPLA